jgi:hypothetical protein
VILGSDSGEVWLPRRSGLSSTFGDVAWGDGRFVAVGWDERPDGTRPGVVVASTDGRQWTRLPALGDELRRVIWDGSGWVVAGGDRTLVRSTCLGPLLAVDRELLQIPVDETVMLELTLSEAVADDAIVEIASSHPGCVSVPATVTVLAGSDRASIPVTGLAVGDRATLTFTMEHDAGGRVLTSLAVVQPPGWTPRQLGGRVAP